MSKVKKEDLVDLINDYNLEIFDPNMGWIDQFHLILNRTFKAIVQIIMKIYLKQSITITLMKIGTMFG